MRIGNLFDFTESHRFYAYRGFSLDSFSLKILYSIYQPMIGPGAVGLYCTLYYSVPMDKLGFSAPEQQRRLFLALGMEMNETGRKRLIEFSSRLEAVGLLQTVRKYIADSDEFVYEYTLLAPLMPDEFFQNQHLVMLLRDKLGKHAVLALRNEFAAAYPADRLPPLQDSGEQLTVPFYDLFRLNLNSVDEELEQTLMQMAPARETAPAPIGTFRGFSFAELLMRIPRQSANRPYIEALRNDPEGFAAVNYTAAKYMLTLAETCRLLDEDGIFSPDGDLWVEELQYRAAQLFRQKQKHASDRNVALAKLAKQPATGKDSLLPQKPVDPASIVDVPQTLQGNMTAESYSLFLKNAPYTQVLALFFPGAVPSQTLKLFETVDFHFKLPEEVINALIHYLMANRKSIAKPFVEAIVANLLSQRIHTFEQAIAYFRDIEQAIGKRKSAAPSGKGRAKQKPKLPVAPADERPHPVSEERLDEIKKLALKLKSKPADERGS
ncbi:MAG TPA: DnaD domain protein [Bacilli bacterium]